MPRVGLASIVDVRRGPDSLAGRRAGTEPVLGVGELEPPPGYVFLVETIESVTYYLVDSDGYFLVELD